MSDEIDQRQAELRQRARRRVIGVAVLATLLVVVVPRILERESQPVGHDISVQMPSRDGNSGSEGARSAESVAGRLVGGKIEPSPAAAPGVVVAAASNAGTATDSAAPIEAAPDKVAAAEPSPAAVTPAPGASLPAASAPAAPAPAAPPPAAVGAPPVAAPAPAPEPVPKSAREPVPAKPAPTPAAAKTPLHKPVSAAKGGVLVQVGVFADASKALQLESRLAGQGFKVHRETIATASGTRTRVRVGPYASRAEADKAVARLAALHENALVVKP